MLQQIRAAALPLALLTALAALALTGCAPYVSPCTRLAPPTAQEIDLANTGADIEREIEGVECDLVNGAWEEDADESAYSAPKSKPKATAARATPKKKT